MKKAITIFVFVLLIFSSTASANVYYATPPTVYVQPDPSYQTGQAIGNLLGALIQGANQQAEQEKRQKQIEELRVQLNELAKSEAIGMKQAIEQGKVKELWDGIQSFVYSQEMCNPVLNNSNGIFTISYLKDLDGGAKMFREYAINTQTNQCRCIIKVSPFNIEAGSVQQINIQQQPQKQVSLTEAVGNYLGIVTSTEKTPEGGFRILSVAPGGISEFAGVRQGDILVKIDTYDLKDIDIERVASYIALRYQQKQSIKATVLRNGANKVFNIQL